MFIFANKIFNFESSRQLVDWLSNVNNLYSLVLENILQKYTKVKG